MNKTIFSIYRSSLYAPARKNKKTNKTIFLDYGEMLYAFIIKINKIIFLGHGQSPCAPARKKHKRKV